LWNSPFHAAIWLAHEIGDDGALLVALVVVVIVVFVVFVVFVVVAVVDVVVVVVACFYHLGWNGDHLMVSFTVRWMMHLLISIIFN
jgi:hypothetical protein